MLLLMLLIVATASSGAAHDPLRQVRSLEEAVAANPNNGSALRELAHAYALALLQPNRDVASYAAAALDNSSNIWILGNAAYMLQCQYNETLQRGSPNERAAMLAERYFLRARNLDPKLDRRAILPQIDLQQIANASRTRAQEQQEWTRRFEEASRSISRLRPEAFPDLPRAIAAVLRARNCTVPQPSSARPPRNVIQGEFFEPGQQSWAVLCSVNGWSTVLVFRTAQDSTPHGLARMDDRNFLIAAPSATSRRVFKVANEEWPTSTCHACLRLSPWQPQIREQDVQSPHRRLEPSFSPRFFKYSFTVFQFTAATNDSERRETKSS